MKENIEGQKLHVNLTSVERQRFDKLKAELLELFAKPDGGYFTYDEIRASENTALLKKIADKLNQLKRFVERHREAAPLYEFGERICEIKDPKCAGGAAFLVGERIVVFNEEGSRRLYDLVTNTFLKPIDDGDPVISYAVVVDSDKLVVIKPYNDPEDHHAEILGYQNGEEEFFHERYPEVNNLCPGRGTDIFFIKGFSETYFYRASLETGAVTAYPSKHERSVSVVRFLSDGRLVTVDSRGGINIRDYHNFDNDKVETVRGSVEDGPFIKEMIVTQDDNFILLNNYGQLIKIKLADPWPEDVFYDPELPTGGDEPMPKVNFLVGLPNNRFATSDENGIIKIWEASGPSVEKVNEDFAEEKISHLDASADGKLIATGINGTIRVWQF